MSAAKFASLTASLLARKGEARPSEILPSLSYPPPWPEKANRPPVLVVPAREVSRPAAEAYADTPEPERKERASAKAPTGKPPPPAPGPKPHRLMVKLTPSEFETLGLIGVKKGVTRHQLVRSAVDEYLALLVEEYAGDCECIHSACGCRPTA